MNTDEERLRESNAKLRRTVDWLQKLVDIATTRYDQLSAATRKATSDADLARLVRDCVRIWQHPAGNEVARLRQKLEAADRSIHYLREMLRAAQAVANEAYDRWDADEDMKVGKILKALAGNLPNYRADIDRIVEAGKESELLDLPNGET